MPIDVDGASILSIIAREPGIFACVQDQVSVIARGLVMKQLKDKSTTYDALQMIVQSIGQRDFAIIVDHMTDAEVKSILKKVDRLVAVSTPDLTQWRRDRLLALAAGLEAPRLATDVAHATSTIGPKGAGSAKIRRAISSRAMRARKKPST